MFSDRNEASEEELRELLAKVEDALREVMIRGPRSAAMVCDITMRLAATSACLVAVDFSIEDRQSVAREFRELVQKAFNDQFHTMYDSFAEKLKFNHAFDGNAELREELLRKLREGGQ